MRQPKKPDIFTIIIYIMLGIALLYVCAGLGACMDVNAREDGTVDYTVIANNFESVITNTSLVMKCILKKGFALKLTGFGLLAEFIYVLMKVTDKKKLHRHGEEYGSARWATDKEKKALADKPKRKTKTQKEQLKKQREREKKYHIKPVYKPDNNIILTNDVKMTLNTRQTGLNLNVMVVGSAGTGKSRYYVRPNIMQMNTSYVVTDPKGELLRSTGKMLAEQGYKIRVFNLIDMAHSDNYNPFDYVYDTDGNYSENAVVKMINVLMLNTKKEGSSGGDQFWEDATETLLSALCFYLIEVEDESKRNFGEVMKLLKMADVQEGKDDFESDLDKLFAALENPDQEKKALVKRPSEYMCLKYYKDFKKAAGDTLKSILISAAVRLKSFNLPKVADLTCCDTLKINEIGDQKTALFIIIPASDKTFNFLAAMLFTQMFDTLYDRANFKYGGSLPVHVRCLIDEFANIGQIPQFKALLATMRGMGISANIILQNLSDLKELYKESWESILGNCQSFLFLGGQEPSTLEYLVKALDKETIDTVSRSRSKGKNSSSSTNDGILGRELMTTSELKLMKTDECILMIATVPPMFSKKYKLERHPNYKRIEEYNKKNAFLVSEIHTKQVSLPEDDNDIYSENVVPEDFIDQNILNEIHESCKLGKKIISETENDIPVGVDNEVITDQPHMPLIDDRKRIAYESEKAEISSTDTTATQGSYSEYSEYDNFEE